MKRNTTYSSLAHHRTLLLFVTILAVLSCSSVTPATAATGTIALVIAPENFRDEELSVPRAALASAGWSTVVASTRLGTATGMLHDTCPIACTIESLDATTLAALVIVGGTGAPTHLYDCAPLHRLATVMHQAKKPVAAICLSPGVLARAGLLKDRKATVYANDVSKKAFADGGATLATDSCVIDGNLVTANGPEAAAEFAAAIVELLGRP